MKKSDLYREWARVLDMCEGTNVDPGRCCDFNGNRNPGTFTFSENPDCYKFAVAILEDKPVFVGDKVYANNCTSPLTVEGSSKQLGYISVGNCVNYHISILSWNSPKKTFLLNGEELPCPRRGEKAVYQHFLGSKIRFFESSEDRLEVIKAIDNLLEENTSACTQCGEHVASKEEFFNVPVELMSK